MITLRFAAVLIAGALVLGVANPSHAAPAAEPVADRFVTLVAEHGEARAIATQWLETHWEPAFVPMAVDAAYLRLRRGSSADLVALLERQTGQSFGFDFSRWREWVWSQGVREHSEYASFKARAYRIIDPAFEQFFRSADQRTPRALIDLSEVVWGGVGRDAIPALRTPRMVRASEATYLRHHNIVFGIKINGDVRAYPKRILAWHEMFTDVVGGKNVAGVYCTLCGAVILYETKTSDAEGATPHQLGTSGLLYRSNKLMYDRATLSLWSTMRGEPVVGPLVGRNIKLPRLSVVTTTWGEWLRRHPESLVLSEETGYHRNYAEGIAYGSYFATDELMFPVSKRDGRLPNKQEVFAVLAFGGRPLAISTKFLMRHPVWHGHVGQTQIVVLTDASGANRAYDVGEVRITEWDRRARAIDSNNMSWSVLEDALVAADGRRLHRFPAHRAFWFGWYAAYPNTRLVMRTPQ